MTKEQLHRQLKFIHKDLTKAETRMMKIATKLDIDRNEYLERCLWEMETLLEMFEEKDNVPTEV